MNIIENKVKEAAKKNKPTLGAWIQIGHPAMAEIYTRLCFDWNTVDIEHSAIGLERFTDIIRGIYDRGIAPFARVRENDTLAIRQVLDCGAVGVIVPLVDTAEDAKKAVRAAKYPPNGERGFAFCRANNWGTDFDEYAKEANRQVMVIIMIESKAAVENINEIVQLEGVDGVFIGPYDLSGSYGVVGNTNHEKIVTARKLVIEACKKHNKIAGLHDVCPTEASIKSAVGEGFSFIALGTDGHFLRESANNALKAAQKAILSFKRV